MTDFQRVCEQKLVNRLNQESVPIKSRVVAENDAYVAGRADQYQFWIYDDGADFKSDWFGKVYEKYDYKSLEDLADQFVEDLVFAINNREVLRADYEKKKPNSILRRLFGRWSCW